MEPKEITCIRTKLGFTQTELSQILNIHYITLSRWERGHGKPNAYIQALLTLFKKIEYKNMKNDNRTLLFKRGPIHTLTWLLNKSEIIT